MLLLRPIHIFNLVLFFFEKTERPWWIEQIRTVKLNPDLIWTVNLSCWVKSQWPNKWKMGPSSPVCVGLVRGIEDLRPIFRPINGIDEPACSPSTFLHLLFFPVHPGAFLQWKRFNRRHCVDQSRACLSPFSLLPGVASSWSWRLHGFRYLSYTYSQWRYSLLFLEFNFRWVMAVFFSGKKKAGSYSICIAFPRVLENAWWV